MTENGVALRLAGVIEQSLVDGPGLRMAVFTQGCPHHCAGCHNPGTHSFAGGFQADVGALLAAFDENPILAGATLSGGEPLVQAAGLITFARGVKARGKDVWCYTGYVFEDVLVMAGRDEALSRLLRYVDVMVDGRFDAAKKSASLRYRGSSNQRIVNVSASCKKQRTVLL